MAEKNKYKNGLLKNEWSDVVDSFGTYHLDEVSSSKKKKFHSDYWTGKYNVGYDYNGTKSAAKDWKLKRCLHDVARIATIFEKDARVGYLSKERSKNSVNSKEILLDPRIALEDKEFGEKVDYYAGEVLVNSAYRSVFNKEDRSTYFEQYMNLCKEENDPTFSFEEKVVANLFMSIESNRAHQLITKKTPGFKPYAKARAEEKVLESNEIIPNFLNNKDDKIRKLGSLCSLIREIDTDNLLPLDSYSDDLNDVVNESLDKARGCKNTKDSLSLAKHLYNKYKFEELEGIDLPTFNSSMGGKEGEQDGKGDSVSQAIDSSLTTKGMHGGMGENSEELQEYLKDLESKLSKVGVSYDSKYAPKDLSKWQEGDLFDGMVKDMTGTIYSFEQYYAENKHTVNREGYRNYDKHKNLLDADGEISINDHVHQKKFYNELKEKNYHLIEAIRDSLTFSNSDVMSWEETAKRSGFLDEGGLDKVAYRSNDLFYEPIIESTPRVLCSIVVDQSASMSTAGMHAAKEISIAIAEATRDIKGVDLLVYIQSGGTECNIGRYITLDTPYEDYHRLSFMPIGCHTYDGHTINAIGNELAGIDGYDRRMIFMISDGEPSGSGYEGVEAYKHTSSVSKHLRNNLGVEVYGFGVNGAYDVSNSFKGKLAKSGIHGSNKGELLYGEGNAIAFEGFEVSEIVTKISTFLGHVCGKD